MSARHPLLRHDPSDLTKHSGERQTNGGGSAALRPNQGILPSPARKDTFNRNGRSSTLGPSMSTIIIGIFAIGALAIGLPLLFMALAFIVIYPYWSVFIILTAGCALLAGPIGVVFGFGLTIVVWTVMYMVGVKTEDSCPMCNENVKASGREYCNACGKKLRNPINLRS